MLPVQMHICDSIHAGVCKILQICTSIANVDQSLKSVGRNIIILMIPAFKYLMPETGDGGLVEATMWGSATIMYVRRAHTTMTATRTAATKMQ